ncbi:hypothetical protein [Fulvivirga ligni]|uniref:hypothetical protein n=1 Tax=Fulvivirga ligni TaxID=2904246 RepID=UPI001F481153|nr:hypothetical protein [Fulvivirga ligni]UII24184.1 hypothetical protein LVD16_13260 [Fulvivirga ligni]
MCRLKRGVVLPVLFIFSISFTYGQSVNKNWKSDLQKDFSSFQTCESASEDCHQYMGKSLNTVYQLNDFYDNAAKEYMGVGEINDLLASDKSWTNLGPAYSQDVLSKAQQHANSNKAVVAVYVNQEGVGHVVMILPGTLQPSGSWGLKVPNSASFFAKQPSRSFTNKGLSYAFSKSILKDVKIYSRNY